MTREEAIKELRESHDMIRSYNIDESESRLMTALNMAIQVLEQNGTPLDKIRADIEQLYTVDTVYEDVVAVDKTDVLQIIDKYR